MSTFIDQVNWYNMVDASEAIYMWANRTFPMRKAEEALTKLVLEEIPELLMHKKEQGVSDIGPELADCFILLLDLARMWGVHLPSALYQKMMINDQRMWRRDPILGHYNHVAIEHPPPDFTTAEAQRARGMQNVCVICGRVGCSPNEH